MKQTEVEKRNAVYDIMRVDAELRKKLKHLQVVARQKQNAISEQVGISASIERGWMNESLERP